MLKKISSFPVDIKRPINNIQAYVEGVQSNTEAYEPSILNSKVKSVYTRSFVNGVVSGAVVAVGVGYLIGKLK